MSGAMDRHKYDHCTTDELVKYANDLINYYMLHNGEKVNIGGGNVSTYCQAKFDDLTMLPVQGWKMHIGADNLSDYVRLLEVALPEFEKLGILYKVADPEQLHTMQTGKNMVIYPTPAFNPNLFSSELKEILMEPARNAEYEQDCGGRKCARYGKFNVVNQASQHTLTSPTGAIEVDPRGQKTCPDFVVSDKNVFNFYAEAAQRYEETGSFKRYIQEAATMCECIPGYNAFVTIEFDPKDMIMIQDMLARDPNGLSYVYNVNGQMFGLIHNDYASQALARMDMDHQFTGFNYKRPDWDKEFNLFQIAPESIGSMIDVVNQYNAQNQSPNSPEMSWIQLDENNWAIKVDTTVQRHFEEQCIEHGIYIKELMRQVNDSQIAEHVQDLQQQGLNYDITQTY